jgi:hypothetical protein
MVLEFCKDNCLLCGNCMKAFMTAMLDGRMTSGLGRKRVPPGAWFWPRLNKAVCIRSGQVSSAFHCPVWFDRRIFQEVMESRFEAEE